MSLSVFTSEQESTEARKASGFSWTCWVAELSGACCNAFLGWKVPGLKYVRGEKVEWSNGS